ncbi:unnamed protein product [Cochlearia groenlandica]
MAEEYKNASEDFKNVPQQETPKIATTTEEPSETTETGEVKSRGLFDFLGKKEEAKPQETTTLESEFENKTQISEPPLSVAKHQKEEEKEHKPTLLEELHQKHVEEEENKPSLLQKLHRSNSSSSSSSEEEGEDGEKRKKNKKKVLEGEEKTEKDNKGIVEQIKEKFPHETKTEDDAPVVTHVPVSEPPVATEETEEKKGFMEKIKKKLPGHETKTEDDAAPVATPVPVVAEPPVTEEKKGFMEKIKEKLPGHHAKSSEEDLVKKEKETDA